MKRYLKSVFEGSEEENRQAIERAVAAHGPFESMLDLGCYDGDVTMRVASAARAKRVSGLELLEQHAVKARALGLEVELGDVEKRFPYEDETFDLVHANQVIEHLRNTDGFLQECRRVCSPDGLVVLSTNNLSSWHNVFTLMFGMQPMPIHVSDEVHVGNPLNPRSDVPHEDFAQSHLRLFVGRALVELAEHHGLELVELTTSGYYPLPPNLARRMTKVDRAHGAFLIALFKPAPLPAVEPVPAVTPVRTKRRGGAVARATGLVERRRGSGPSASRSGTR
jgi:SAM-dependent methyltransferase